MKKQKKIKTFLYRLTRLLSERQRRALVLRSVQKRIPGKPISFPINPAHCRNILIILPDEEIEQLHQISNLLSLCIFFANARITLLCTNNTPDFFHTLPGITETRFYQKDDRLLFGKEFDALTRQISTASFDVVILLDKEPDLALLNMVGQTGADYRIGYWHNDNKPFINLGIKLSSDSRYLSESNMVLARMIGASTGVPVRWSVAKNASEHIRGLLKEYRVEADQPLIGIDFSHFSKKFGTEWTGQLLIAMVAKRPDLKYWATADDTSENESAPPPGVPDLLLLPQLSTSRMAALVERSRILIAGNSLLYQLAVLLHKPAIGLFERETRDRYFKAGLMQSAILYHQKPDNSTISQICTASSGFTNPAPRVILT